MKQTKTTRIIAALMVAAFALRVFQIFAVIDLKTGFYKNGSSVLGLVLTVATLALCAVAAILARNTASVTDNSFALSKASAIISCVVSFALFYELLFEGFLVQGASWQVLLMKILGFSTAVYFGAIPLSGILKFKIPDIFHTLPALYMIIRIICSFINISSLSLIAENIFLLASYCCALLFFVKYAGFYCLGENNKTLKFHSVLACSLCYATSASNIIANVFAKNGYTHIPLSSQLVLIALALFIGNFIFERFVKKGIE